MSIFNILFLVFSFLFIVSAVLEIIAYHKKISLMEYIAKPCMYVFLISGFVMLLIPFVPDSLNIIVWNSTALVFALIGSCLQFFPKKRKIIIISSLLFVASFLCYTALIFPSFRLFSIPLFISILIFVLYLTLFVLYYLFIIGKRNIIKTVSIAIFMIPLMILHYGSILTLCGQPKIYSLLLFIGCTIFIASQAMIVKGFFIKATPFYRLLRMILYIAGQFFVTAGFSLMVI